MYLLDTCVVIWLAGEPRRLSSRARSAIATSRTRVFISAITAWEIALKANRGQLELSLPPLEWLDALCRTYRIGRLSLRHPEAIAAASLPSIHRDPADRMIIATAMARGLPIITPDPRINAYPGIATVW